MSKLIVEVCRVEKVERHPNADRLAIATVKGWRTGIRYDPITGKAEFEPGDLCVYFPPDCVLQPELGNGPDDSPPGRLGIRRFLAQLPKGEDGQTPPGRRVKSCRLQGIPSHGFAMPLDSGFGDDLNWAVGTDVADHFGVTKWEPPEPKDPNAEREHSRFHRYTEIESFGNFPQAIEEGTEVVFTEKIHGKNNRAGLVFDEPEIGPSSWLELAGCHNLQLKPNEIKGRQSAFWQMFDHHRALLVHLREHLAWVEPKVSIITFGELYGNLDMKYGLRNGNCGIRLFDIAINGQYLDFDLKHDLCKRFGVEMVPILYRGPFSAAVVEKYTCGPTTLCTPEVAGKFKGREGIVITPVKEVHSSILNGRCILKSKSADFGDRPGGTDAH